MQPGMLSFWACIHTGACVHTHAHVHTYAHVHTHACIHMHTYVHTHARIHVHTHTCTHMHMCTHTLYLCWLSRAAARPWTSVSPRGREGPLRGKKRKGSGYLEGRTVGALSLPEGGVRGACGRPPRMAGKGSVQRVRPGTLDTSPKIPA